MADGVRLLEILSSHHLELDSFQGQRARAQCSSSSRLGAVLSFRRV